MKFTFSLTRTITWPVKVRTPTDGGRYRDDQFDLTMELLDQDEYDQIVADNPTRADYAILERVTKGWTVVDAQGEPVPVEPETVRAVYAIPYVRVAAMQAYLSAVVGGRAKN